jgi:hypothetical protein
MSKLKNIIFKNIVFWEVEKFEFSNHAKEQIQFRDIEESEVIQVLKAPQQVVMDSSGKEKVVYQSIFKKDSTGDYLIRVFVNSVLQPKRVITVYKTSKIKKYWNYETDL